VNFSVFLYLGEYPGLDEDTPTEHDASDTRGGELGVEVVGGEEVSVARYRKGWDCICCSG